MLSVVISLANNPGYVKDKNRPTHVSSATTNTKKATSGSKKNDQLSPSSSRSHHRGRRSRRGQGDRERDGGDWSNLPVSNLPEDWGTEKEVTEEKQTSTGK